MTNKEMLAEIEKLKAELAAAKAPKATGELSCKVSEKGAVSVYGLGRFPITLYSEQWARVFAASDRIKAFISANSGRLSTKANPIAKATDAPTVPQDAPTQDAPAADAPTA